MNVSNVPGTVPDFQHVIEKSYRPSDFYRDFVCVLSKIKQCLLISTKKDTASTFDSKIR